MKMTTVLVAGLLLGSCPDSYPKCRINNSNVGSCSVTCDANQIAVCRDADTEVRCFCEDQPIIRTQPRRK